MYEAIVKADNFAPVRMREEPSTSGKVIASVPQGTTVQVVKKVSDKWSQIKYNDQTGYMMTQYLATISDTTVTKEDLQRVYNSLADALKTIQNILK